MKFSCGCDIDVDNLDMETVRTDCPAVFHEIKAGNTKGMFQLESPLCRHWCKEIAPSNISELAAVISLVRPGCLKAKTDGKSMTQHYADRKNGKDEVVYANKVSEKALSDTFGILTYQEQAMEIAKLAAGFTLQEADILRKAIGHKLADEMAKIKTMFLDKAKSFGVLNEKEAADIFDNIEKSQRYSFNRCFSGDTIIKKGAKGRFCKKNLSIEEMYLIRNDIEYAKSTGHNSLRKKWKRIGNYGKSWSLNNDGRLRPNTIADIRPGGFQEVFLITLECGAAVRVSELHSFPTRKGKMMTKELSIGDELYVCGDYEPTDSSIYKYSRSTGEKGYPTLLSKIKSIEFDGSCRTYDITMSAPNHTLTTESGIVACNSHAVAYALLGYWSAYIKTHFPQRFYTSWLSFAKQKQDANEEKRELVNDAKINGIDIRGPDLRSLNIDFEPDGEAIKFGIGNIKGIGEAMIEKLVFVVKNEVEPKIGSTSSWTWYDFLTEFSRRVSTTVVKALISSGSLSYMGISRTRMLYEFEVWNALTEKEQNWIIEQRPTFSDLLSAMSELQKPKKEGGGVANKNRAAKVADSIKSLVNPPHSLKDRPDRIAFDEEQLLGIAISFNQIEACDTREANTSCRDFVDGKDDDYMVFAVSVDKVREITTKTGKSPGQKMAFLVVSDSTCSLDNCVIFPDAYAEFGVELVENNTVLLQGSRDNKKGSLIVNKVWSI